MIQHQTAVIGWLYRLIDCLILVLALPLASRLRIMLELGAPGEPEAFSTPAALPLLICLIWLTAFQLCKVYSFSVEVRWWQSGQRLLFGHTLAALLFFGVLYLTYRNYSRLQSAYFLALTFVGLIGYRALLLVLSTVFGYSVFGQCPVLVVGTDANALRIAKAITRFNWAGFHFLGFVRQYATDQPHPEAIGRILGETADLNTLIQAYHVREIIIAINWSESKYPADLLRIVQERAVRVRLAPDYSSLADYHISLERFGGVPLIGIRDDVFSPSQRLLKRVFDLFLSVAVLSFGFPLFVGIGICIWLEDGRPLIIRQMRVGEHGRLFTMYKFRSMFKDAERQLPAKNDLHKRPNDPRITGVGRILRRTSLDELPQFINILRGDMSVVGPRPEMPWLVEQYEPWQRKRFDVPQGLTGWWQINGRADRPMHRHTADDLFYIQHYSIWLDVQIVFRTILAVIVGRGAY